MAGNTVAETMARAMLEGCITHLENHEFTEVIEQATNFSESIAGHNKQVAATFGALLPPFAYAIALSRHFLQQQTPEGQDGGAAAQELSRALDLPTLASMPLTRGYLQDLHEKLQHGDTLDVSEIPDHIARLREMTQDAVPASSPGGSRWLAYALQFLVGLLLFSAAGAILYAVGLRHPTPKEYVIILCVLPAVAVFALAMKGWGWMSEYAFGSVGNFLKFLAMLAIAATGIGMLPMCYWAGKGAARLLGRE